MIWCGECGYKGKGLYLENEVYCPYCKATGNDIVVLPIDNNTRNLTNEDVQPVDRWISIEESKPKDTQQVLAVVDGDVREAFYNTGCFIGSNFYRSINEVKRSDTDA